MCLETETLGAAMGDNQVWKRKGKSNFRLDELLLIAQTEARNTRLVKELQGQLEAKTRQVQELAKGVVSLTSQLIEREARVQELAKTVQVLFSLKGQTSTDHSALPDQQKPGILCKHGQDCYFHKQGTCRYAHLS